MRRVIFPMPGAVGCALALGLTLSAARAGEPPVETSMMPFGTRSLAARGPISFSLAAEPSALRWGVETGFPLGLGSGGASTMDPWRLDAFVHAAHQRDQVTSAASLGYTLRLERARERSATWLGVSSGGARGPGEPITRLQLGAGRVQMFGGVQAEASWITSSVLFRNDPRWASFRTFPIRADVDTPLVLYRDTTVMEPNDHATRWNTAQGSLRWQKGRLAITGVGGVSLGEGVRSRRWAQAGAEWQLTRRVLFMASYGERPAPSMAFKSEAHPRTMVGVQFAPWATKNWAMASALKPSASAWKAELGADDQLEVRVRCHDVSSAEIAGDFTDWRPFALTRLGGGWWGGVVRVPPGLHRVQLRLNGGAWMAPPGLPRADDGPGGPSATLLVAPAD